MKYATHIMTNEVFKKAVVSIGTRGKNLDRDTHAAAVAALIASLPADMGGHLNATPALQLCQAMSAGQARNKVIAWFTYFSNIRITVSKQKDGSFKWGCKNLGPNADAYLPVDEALVMAAIKLPFYDLNPEPDMAEVDVSKLIAAAIKKITAAAAAGKLKADPANDLRIAGLRKLVAIDTGVM
jgi:hypothetical protein